MQPHDPDALRESAIDSLPLLHRGKVRDIYEVDDARLLIVATDRLSAFDVVLPDPIPGKGRILNRLSTFWFGQTAHLARNHLLDQDPREVVRPEEKGQVHERAVVVRRLQALPVEAIVRGYLAGSGWQAYQRAGAIHDVPLPAGLRLAERLPEPIFTPTTKAGVGDHDAPISYAETEELLGEARAAEVRASALRLYAFAAEHARRRGLIIADTKLEFGVDEDDGLVVIDELFTPDSSRFWPADAWQPGTTPPAFDKQFIRDHLDALGWDRESAPPRLSEDVIRRTAEKYHEAERRLTSPE